MEQVITNLPPVGTRKTTLDSPVVLDQYCELSQDQDILLGRYFVFLLLASLLSPNGWFMVLILPGHFH